MGHLKSVEIKNQRRLIVTWSITFLVLFPFLIFLGFLLRIGQGEMTKLLLKNFYSLMTFHGIGMVTLLFSFSLAILWYLISTRFAKLNLLVGYFLYATLLIAMVGLTIGILIGKFGTGWHMLYPLPFRNATWLAWSAGVSIISLIILGTAWLVSISHILYSLSKEFGGIPNLLGWQYLRKKDNRKELPPIILITTISLIPVLLEFMVGAVMLFMYLFQFIEPALKFDPFMLGNITIFFGNTFINTTLFCGVGWVYLLLPEFTGREWKTDKVLVYFWNATFLLILLAYIQNLYIDFVKSFSTQYTRQMFAYVSAAPATIITIAGAIVQFYQAKIKWMVIPLMFLSGIAGWAIGGFTAFVESIMAFHKVLNNTMWVPAHLHTTMLLGLTLFIFSFLFYLISDREKQSVSKVAKFGFWLFVAGGYGFVLTLYIEGVDSIPRRYARYTGIGIKSMHDTAVLQAQISVFFVIILFIGLFMMSFSLFSKLRK